VIDATEKMRQGLPADLSLAGSIVSLQPLQKTHADDLLAAASDGELWGLKYTSVPGPDTITETIDEALKQRNRGRQLPFVVRSLNDNKIIGATRYYLIDPDNRNLSIGYTWYAKSVQRTGANTECKLLLLTHAFETLGCISVQWHTDNLNKRSQAAIERLGAKFEGILRNHRIMPDGRYRHTYCYSMLDDEWPAAKKFLSERLAQPS